MSNQEYSDIVVESMTFLELPAVLDEVASHALSESGRTRISSAVPENDVHRIKVKLDSVIELKEMVRLFGPLSLGGLLPMDELFQKLENQASIMDIEEILAVGELITIADHVLERLEGLPDRFVQLKGLSARITSHGALKHQIARTIDHNGAVRPDASPELIRIHSRARTTRELVIKRLEGFVKDRDLAYIVQEDYVTLRNDRYVILLRPEFHGFLDGIVHDHSRSGASVYVEPFQVVELNNQIAALADEERAEVRKIVERLTQDIRGGRSALTVNFNAIVQLDELQARALYAIATSSISPELVDAGFRIVGARHPLLLADDQSEVVPMDVVQDSTTLATVISGANMGGKTVALKIAGLFPLMIECGILIPAREGTKIQPFKRVMADIGDDQDLRGRISSFAGHMLRAKAILEIAAPGDLVLLDEIGGATDPDEGSALAMAIADELIDRSISTVVTTHLTHLKAYAMARPGAKNVSVEFHPETLKPTFHLLYDFPGESHAILTAERIGLDKRVLDSAKKYSDQSAGGSARLLQNLREKIAQTEKLEQDLVEKKASLDEEYRNIQSQKKEIVEDFRTQCLTMIRKAEMQIADLQKSLKSGAKKSGVKPREALGEIKKEMIFQLGSPLEKISDTPSIGATVRLMTLGKIGTVTAVFDNGRVEVAVGKVTVNADLNDLKIISQKVQEKNPSKMQQIGLEIPTARPKWDVKIIGLLVDEAIPIVEKAIDEAILGGLTSITIIHGRGTGRLKKAVRDCLNEHVMVRDYRSGDLNHGGDAVTIVELASD